MKINKIDESKWIKPIEICNESKMITMNELKLIKIIFCLIKKLFYNLKKFFYRQTKLTKIEILADGGKKIKIISPFNF